MAKRRKPREALNRNEIRLTSKYRVFLSLTIWILWLTGLFLFLITLEFFKINAFLAPNIRILHGCLAYFFLVLFGILFVQHIPTGLMGTKNKKSGIGLISVTLFLIISGLALYYSGNEWIRENVILTHTIVGLGFPWLFVWHYRGRIIRK